MSLHPITAALAAFVALEHIGFMVLEMALWTKPLGRAVFKTTALQAEQSATLAANQGLYNGFLAAGLLFALATGDRRWLAFFLGCVVVAGAYGAYSVSPRILLVQAAPALAAIVLLGLTGRELATP